MAAELIKTNADIKTMAITSSKNGLVLSEVFFKAYFFRKQFALVSEITSDLMKLSVSKM